MCKAAKGVSGEGLRALSDDSQQNARSQENADPLLNSEAQAKSLCDGKQRALMSE